MRKIWVHKAKSFKEAEEFDLEYYRAMSPSERLQDMQLLREIFYKIKNGKPHARGKRLQRVAHVIQ
ncbi:MAG: hypothetical protein HYS08_05275 [Chlamydiae bacterium]|nr:hypothetical protein [Chlamydiota bacterium]MBI3266767.1 hypothetical protein [Chlamydiota bacterium]